MPGGEKYKCKGHGGWGVGGTEKAKWPERGSYRGGAVEVTAGRRGACTAFGGSLKIWVLLSEGSWGGGVLRSHGIRAAF